MTLYTPEILRLATALAAHPFDAAMPWQGEARSPTCGSHIALSLDCDPAGRILRCGIRAQACAIGQASAAIFLGDAATRDHAALTTARTALGLWLSGAGPAPDWHGIGTLAPARDYPARHGAILLPWVAALAALPPCEIPR